MKTILMVLSCLVLSISYGFTQILDFSVAMEQSEFRKGDNVWISVQLTNLGSTELEVRSPTIPTGGIGVKLFDSQNRELQYRGGYYSVLGTGNTKLKPLAKIFQLIQLNSLYGDGISIATTHKYLPPGSYKVIVTYRSGKVEQFRKELTFQVVEPTGDEMKAYDSFVSTLLSAGNRGITFAEAASRFETLEREHPNSVYTPIAMSILAAWYIVDLNNPPLGRATYVRLVEKFPDAVKMPGILSSSLSALPDNERKSFFEKVAERAKGNLTRGFLEANKNKY